MDTDRTDESDIEGADRTGQPERPSAGAADAALETGVGAAAGGLGTGLGVGTEAGVAGATATAEQRDQPSRGQGDTHAADDAAAAEVRRAGAADTGPASDASAGPGESSLGDDRAEQLDGDAVSGLTSDDGAPTPTGTVPPAAPSTGSRASGDEAPDDKETPNEPLAERLY